MPVVRVVALRNPALLAGFSLFAAVPRWPGTTFDENSGPSPMHLDGGGTARLLSSIPGCTVPISAASGAGNGGRDGWQSDSWGLGARAAPADEEGRTASGAVPDWRGGSCCGGLGVAAGAGRAGEHAGLH